MITALIAEDEPLLAQALQAELSALWPDLHIADTVGDGASALAAALAQPPDICFFDIRMPGMSGLDAAQALAEDWPAEGAAFPLIVFVTAYDQYALQAFEAQAVDYVVKPVQRERLAACVVRLQARLAERAPRGETLEHGIERLRALLGTLPQAAGAAPRLAVIQAQVGSVVHMVPIEQVIYFEAADKYVRVVTSEREHLIRTSLKELMPQLDAARFWQVHRGTVVRADAIASALREDSGKVILSLHGRTEKLSASRLYAHLFRGM